MKWALLHAIVSGAAAPQYTQQGHPSILSRSAMANLVFLSKSLALVSLRIASTTPFFHQQRQLLRWQGLNVESLAVLDEVVNQIAHLLGVVYG